MSYPYAPGAQNEYSETYVFPTDNGSFYIVEFYKALNHFTGSEEVLMNSKLVFEIAIKRSYLEGPPPRKKRNDPEVYPTISDILDKL
ncbi:hypothetical protein [Chitinophaga pinensis]|uniref:Uncharacterized protein n=1 Tax=Chitinophaga pinensis (strain ATCC 43595 / DSM 2588 / LMG 13176 / NBRC 15968 / NCIMB 11800 / UQM 2034) TaxID=485918 RepID=A0A979GAK7_CHIPD|nr:hypothetical protein [Chitinophaga pinensis]ACU63751.1 hypothetical protein Cpin_6346 [Chitinophaga pinensis DSM 2588]